MKAGNSSANSDIRYVRLAMDTLPGFEICRLLCRKFRYAMFCVDRQKTMAEVYWKSEETDGVGGDGRSTGTVRRILKGFENVEACMEV